MSSIENPNGPKRKHSPHLPHSNENAAKLNALCEPKLHRGFDLEGNFCKTKTRTDRQSNEDKKSIMVLPQSNEHSDRRHHTQSDEKYSDGSGTVLRASSSAFANDKAALIDFEDYTGTHFIDNDAEYDRMEEEEEEDAHMCNDDPFANQFIHIGIPATGLKDVSRVKKDLYHDRVNTKKSIMSGLQRAVSSVKISDTRARPAKGNISGSLSSTEHVQSGRDMSNFRQLTRMLSLKKTKSSTFNNSAAKKEESNFFLTGANNLHEDSCKNRIDKERSTYPDSEDTTAPLFVTSLPQHQRQTVEGRPGHQKVLGSSDEASGRVLIQRHRESTARKPSGKRQNMYAGGGRNVSERKHEQTSARPSGVEDICSETGITTSATPDRPRSSRVPSPEALRSSGRTSLSQVGRIMSLSLRKPTGSIRNGVNYDVTDTLKDPSRETLSSNRTRRSSLARIGRAISFSRGRSTSKKTGPESEKETQSISVGKNLGCDTGTCAPIQFNTGETQSISSMRTRALPVSPDSRTTTGTGTTFCGEREKGGSWAETPFINEEISRPKLKAIGRMFSLSTRHYANTTARPSGVQERDNEGKCLGQFQTRGATSLPKLERESKTQPRHATNGGKFCSIEVTSEQVKRSGLARDFTHIRVPIVTMGDFAGPGSRSHWHIDVFTMPHNAVRRECMDLYDILFSMAQSRKDVDISADDIDDLEQWWLVARELFQFYFEVERRILFPWVDSAGHHDVEVQMALKKMRGMKEKLQEHLASVDRVWNEKTFKSQAEMLVIIYKAVDNFIPRLYNYFEDQEVLLPAIAQSYYKVEERTRIDKEIAALLTGDEVRRNKDASNHRLVLLIRWMNSPKLVRAWTGRYLNSWARNMYPTWYQMFEKQHLQIVKAFQNR